MHKLKILFAALVALVLAGCGGPEPSTCDSEWITKGVWNDFQDHLVQKTPGFNSYDDVSMRDYKVETVRPGEFDMRCEIAFDVTRHFDSRDDKELTLPSIPYSVYKEDGQWWYKVHHF
jgi:hypothetical protein